METLTLHADTTRLLDLVIHSLYTQREIFLRELVSNASDALDRFRVESLSHPEWGDDGAALEIRLEADPAARTLTVRDNGIGMSRDEVVSNIGTIARSGIQEFVGGIDAASPESRDQALRFIGRFGVGFYSSFMAADKVTLVTCRAGEPFGTRWESSGSVQYTIADAGDLPRGTSVTLQLKSVDPDNDIEDYTDCWVLSRVVKRYADFVTYPVVYVGPAGEALEAPAPGGTAAGRVVLNSMKPIWLRRESEVTPEEYTEFYRHLSHDWNEPLLRLPLKAEGRWEYAALVFVPAHAPYDLYYHAAPWGLQLYSQRMLIVENCEALLPRYLRFLKGVVDAADLPLNVSRQSLQDAHHLANIRRWLTRKALETLAALHRNEPERYLAVWREFGRALKEGITEDRDHRERLTPLLLFESSHDAAKLTTLAEYVARMKPDQTEIFHLAGPSRAVIERSPHIEELRARGYDVLYFTEPVDELLGQALTEFEGRRLRSAAKGTLELGGTEERERTEKEVNQQTEALSGLLNFLQTRLAAHVRAIRVSRRLTVSPACLSSQEFDFSPHIERLLHDGGQGHRRRTLEINARHPIVVAMLERFRRDAADPALEAGADLLLGAASLAEGSELPDPVGFNARLAELLEHRLAVETAAADV